MKSAELADDDGGDGSEMKLVPLLRHEDHETDGDESQMERESNMERNMKALGGIVVSSLCDQHGRHVPLSLAAFLVRALALEGEAARSVPDSTADYVSAFVEFDLDADKIDERMQQLVVREAVDRLLKDNDVALDTLRMQVAFETMYVAETRKVMQQRRSLEQENSRAVDEIVTISTSLQEKRQVATLYRSLFKLLISNSWTSKVDRTVEREVARVVETVFPQVGLNAYRMSTSAQKRRQLLEIINVVLGIRLFNREIRKGGAGFEDLPVVTVKELESLYALLDDENMRLRRLCEQYASVIHLEFEYTNSISASLENLQNELTSRRQLLLHVQTLQHETVKAIEDINMLSEHYQTQLVELRSLVGSRSTVPKEEVYPKFIALTTDWQLMDGLRKKNKIRDDIFSMLTTMFKVNFYSSLLEVDVNLSMAKPSKSAADDGNIVIEEHVPTFEGPVASGRGSRQRLQHGAQGQDDPSFSVPVRVVEDKSPDFMQISLTFQGYCPWTIVHRGGMLMPGNPGLGIVRYCGRFFNFVSYSAMVEFVEDPERYLSSVLRIAMQHAELIYLLNLHDAIAHSSISELLEKSPNMHDSSAFVAQTMVDRAVQTETHAIERHIDPNYTWNLWTLRRKALQLANITNKKTHSAQTDMSHFRRDNETQTYKKKRNEDGTMPGMGTQTGITKGTNVAHTAKYIQGLRGKPGATVRTVRYTHSPEVTDSSNPPLNRNASTAADS